MKNLLLTCFITFPAVGAELSLESGAVRLGGGTSAAGAYSITGAPSESKTRSSAGRYSVEGGAVALAIGLQNPDGPLLNLRHQNNAFFLSWRNPASQFILESTRSFQPPTIWSAVPEAPVLLNNTNIINIPFGAGPVHTFFRLRKD